MKSLLHRKKKNAPLITTDNSASEAMLRAIGCDVDERLAREARARAALVAALPSIVLAEIQGDAAARGAGVRVDGLPP